MDSSSEDEDVFIRRKSSSKKIFDSDDETDKVDEDVTEATEDFKLHLSDEEDDDGASIQAKIQAALGEHEDVSTKSDNVHGGTPPSKEAEEAEEADVGSDGNSNTKTNVAHKSINVSSYQGTVDIMKKLNALADSDSESDADGDLEPALKSSSKSKSSSKTTIDSDSDSDGDRHLSNDESHDSVVASKVEKRKPGPERKSKTKAKDAMLEIKAESQRQLRQSNIGLPYHIPKQRSLLDFLNRRKSSSPMPIKGSAEQLAVAWKQIEEREKEVEEFYKSESEEESDADDNQDTEEVDQQPESIPATEPVDHEQEDTTQPDVSKMVPDIEANTVDKIDILPSSSQQNENVTTKIDDQILTTEAVSCDSSERMEVVDVKETDAPEKETDAEINQTTKEMPETLPGVSVSACSNEEPMKELDLKPVEKSMAVRSHSFLSTQDSQNISLHYSETQGTAENGSNKSDVNKKDDTNCNPCDSKTTKENCSSTFGSLLKPENIKEDTKTAADEGEKKTDSTWEEFKACMENIGDISGSDSEDEVTEETVPQKSAFGSGPRLSLKGAPNDVIDLDDLTSDQSRTPGVQGLIERFMKHSASKKKPHQAQTVELSLISSEKDTSGGVLDVKHESLKIVLAGDDNPRSDNQTPGAKLKLLKTELNRQMRKQKEEEWQKKQEEMENEKIFEGEKDDCGLMLDDEEEEEDMTDSEAESEPEIDDVREPKRKKKSKSMFVDEEAEVEDDSNDGAVGVADNEDSEDDENDNEDEDDSDQTSGDEDSDKNKEVLSKGIDGTQNAAQKNNEDENDIITSTAGSLRRTMTSASTDLFASQSSQCQTVADDDDDFIPAGQPNGVSRFESFNERTDETKDKSMLFSPMSCSMPGKTQSFMETDYEITPTKQPWTAEPKPQSGMKKLFGESQAFSTQQKLNELAGLFAGKFNESQDSVAELANVSGNPESETDLMALCSGKFVTQLPQPDELEEDCAQAAASSGTQFSSQTQETEASQVSNLPDEDSVDFSLKFDEDIQNTEDVDGGSKDATKKFRLEIMSSDEEDNPTQTVERKKKNRKLEFSDDEDDNPNNSDADGSDSDGNENDNDEAEVSNNQKPKLFGVFTKPSTEVYYDSDENEIEARDFFEKEAELSEEEDWHGSDDEDEKGLDQLEMNEADKEDIDEDQVREQLVKNQMQKMLDEDRRDVRILQEMLLEDGELHSDTGGRERQFRWKNVDSSGMGDDGHRSDEDHAENDEEEDDAEWRKQRHEREMFLKEQREKQKKEAGCPEDFDDGDEVLENSELLQLGKSVLLKNRSSSLDMSAPKELPPPKLTVHNQLLSPEGKRSNILLTKRGSFLSRGDSVLAKLAKITGPAKENVLAGAKTGGNFVFSTVSPTKKENQTEENSDQKTSKRKASVGFTNPTEKKPCLVAPVRKGSGLFDHL